MNSVKELLLERARAVRADAPAPSPCLSICRMDAATGLCEGCFRSLDEIAAWSTMSDADKRRVWQVIESRAQA